MEREREKHTLAQTRREGGAKCRGRHINEDANTKNKRGAPPPSPRERVSQLASNPRSERHRPEADDRRMPRRDTQKCTKCRYCCNKLDLASRHNGIEATAPVRPLIEG